MNNTEIRNACASFQFKGDDVFKTIDVLSGERTWACGFNETFIITL